MCKSLLGVKSATCSTAVYGELGRMPLYINRYLCVIKYWLKLTTTDNIILKTIYRVAIEDSDRGVNNQITKAKQLLNEHGPTYAWENAHMFCHKQFISLFKQRVTNCFLQNWFSDLNSYGVLDSLYKHVKQYFEIEFYICNIVSRRVRAALTKLRVYHMC